MHACIKTACIHVIQIYFQCLHALAYFVQLTISLYFQSALNIIHLKSSEFPASFKILISTDL